MFIIGSKSEQQRDFFFSLRKCLARNHWCVVCVFSLFCRSCSPWAQEIGSWSRPLCMTVFLSQALVWLSCSSSWVCSPTFKLLLWKPTKNKTKIYFKLTSPDLNQENKKHTIVYLICKIYDYMANTFLKKKKENTQNTLTQALFALESIRFFKSRHIFFML